MQIKRSQEDLNDLLRENLHHMDILCKSFDEWTLSISKLLASVLRTMFHDTSKSSSLLFQLWIDNTIWFLDTCLDFNPNNLIPHNWIIAINYTWNWAKFYAPLGDTPLGINHTKNFSDWWNKKIFSDAKEGLLSRKELILKLANKEWWSHVDPMPDKDFHRLQSGDYLGVAYSTKDWVYLISDAQAHWLRQIAFEVLKTFELNAPPNHRPTSFPF